MLLILFYFVLLYLFIFFFLENIQFEHNSVNSNECCYNICGLFSNFWVIIMQLRFHQQFCNAMLCMSDSLNQGGAVNDGLEGDYYNSHYSGRK